ncbi:hypothetical protein ACLK1S_16810 [Escherichia coli]
MYGEVDGVTFLGGARVPKKPENATRALLRLSVSVVALAICWRVIGGVAAPWLLPMLSAAVPLPLEPANTTVSQPMIGSPLIASPSRHSSLWRFAKAIVCRRVPAAWLWCAATTTKIVW